MAFSNPKHISKFLDKFVKNFCLSIRFANDSTEKQEAFMGLCMSIIANPQGLFNNFPYFCDAICQYDNPPLEMKNLFNDLIYSYKTSFQDEWGDIIKNIPEKLQSKMMYIFKFE